MESFPIGITAITLFTDDLPASRDFYRKVFGLEVHWEDEVSVVFSFGQPPTHQILINLLASSEAAGLIAPVVPRPGPAVQFTITVDDVDATVAEVTSRGATLINGPLDRPWGIRTACFADPSGHIWEIAA